MTNSISKVESSKVEAFENIQLQKSSNVYWLPSDKKDSKDEYVSTNPNKIIITPDEARKTNNVRTIGLSIASATVITAAGIFFLLKGGPKGLSKNFAKLRQNIERLILESNINTGSTPNKWLLYLSKGIEKVSKHFEAVNNFTSFKDMLFTRIMNTTRITGKIHEKITRLFEKIGRRAVVNSYKNTSGRMVETNILSESIIKKLMSGNTYEIIEIDGVRLTKAQWLTKAQNLNKDIVDSYNRHFSEKPLNGRYHKMKKMVEELYEQFKDMKIFASVDALKKFLAESTIAEQKALLHKGVISNRGELSYTLADLASGSNTLILDMVKTLGFKDSKNIKKLADIRGQIYKYANNPTSNPQLKQKITNDILSFRQEIEACLNNKSITNEQAAIMFKKIEELQSGFANFEEGKIQQLLTIYKKILPQSEYEKIAEAYGDTVKSLDKSIAIETEDFLSKLRDLKLGSAPTDILTILGSFAVLGYNLGKSKDNDQRQSIALKYGIPALAGIGVSLFCNAKLYAGSKSLMFGGVSTWLLNRIGEWSDSKLKEYKAQKSKAV